MIILRKDFPSGVKMVAKNGEEVSLESVGLSKFAQWLGKLIPKIGRGQNKFISFDIKDGGGKNIGYLQLSQDPVAKVLILDWIEVDNKYRNNGVARAVIQKVIEYAKSRGFKAIQCEAVGEGPARKLYESLGFKYTGETVEDEGVFGGLAVMELKL